MDHTFFIVFVIGVLAVVSPGPDCLIVSRNSLLYSKKVGLATALGIAAGNAWWIAASVLGIAVLVSKTVLLFNAIKWLGAFYLVYIGARALLSKKQPLNTDTPQQETLPENLPKGDYFPKRIRSTLTPAGAFRIGLITNLLNPKCALFFVSFFSVVITPETPKILQCAYGLEILVIALAWFSLLATVLSADKVKKLFERFYFWIEKITGALLIALGIKVALSHSSAQ